MTMGDANPSTSTSPEEPSMGLLSGVLPSNHRHDPFWGLEGRGVRRRRRLRRLQALLACLGLGAMLLLVLAGPAAYRVPPLF